MCVSVLSPTVYAHTYTDINRYGHVYECVVQGVCVCVLYVFAVGYIYVCACVCVCVWVGGWVGGCLLGWVSAMSRATG